MKVGFYSIAVDDINTGDAFFAIRPEIIRKIKSLFKTEFPDEDSLLEYIRSSNDSNRFHTKPDIVWGIQILSSPACK